MQAKAQPEESYSQSDEPRRVGCFDKGLTLCSPPPSIPSFIVSIASIASIPIAEVFFRRSRLFFREAAFSSGGEECEWDAKQPTVGKSGDKAENEFSDFIPLAVPR